MKKPVIAMIENPYHNKTYKHKFGSRAAIDRWLSHSGRTHLKIVSIQEVSAQDKLPYTLK